MKYIQSIFESKKLKLSIGDKGALISKEDIEIEMTDGFYAEIEEGILLFFQRTGDDVYLLEDRDISCSWYIPKKELLRNLKKFKILDTSKPFKANYNCVIKYFNTNLELHREDGPAVEYEDGEKHWYLNGKRHRENAPAVEYADGRKEWYLNGKLHREDGPAIEYFDGGKEWWVNGNEYNLPSFKSLINRKNGNIIEISEEKMEELVMDLSDEYDNFFIKFHKNKWILTFEGETSDRSYQYIASLSKRIKEYGQSITSLNQKHDSLIITIQ